MSEKEKSRASASASASVPHRHPSVLWSRMKLRWPLLVWAAVAFLALYFGIQGRKYGIVIGTVNVISEEIGSVETARLAAVLVQPGDLVKSGDVVAEIDHVLMDAELAEQEAQYAYEMSTLDSLQWDALQADRQFQAELAAAAEALHADRIQLGQDTAELKAVDAEVRRLADLLAGGLVDAQVLSRLRVQQAALQRSVELFPALIQERERNLQQARARYDETKPWLGGEEGVVRAVQKITAARQAYQKQREAFVQAQRSAQVLRANKSGTVSRVFFQPGSTVAAGVTVVRIVSGDGRVTGFMNETDAHAVAVGMPATLLRNSGRGATFEAKVVEVGPEVEALPQRVSPVPGQTIRGRRFILQFTSPTDLLPGEAVRIQLQQSTWQELWQSIRSLGHGRST
jgi:multidrug resistance efflux pump